MNFMSLLKCLRSVLLSTVLFDAATCLVRIFPTTASELQDLHEVCKAKHVTGVEETIQELRGCLNRTMSNPRTMANMSNKDTSILECRDPRNYRACWGAVATKINECVPGRGDIIYKIQNVIYNALCMDGGSILRNLENSELPECSPNYNVRQCTSKAQLDAWNFLDECKSFRAFRSCQEEALHPCSNDSITKQILERFRWAQEALDCVLPFPDPSRELKRIKVECEQKGITNIRETQTVAIRCLQNADSMFPENDCQSYLERSKCWTPVISKINDCIPERGYAVANIYNALSDVICRSETDRALFKQAELCSPSHPSTACNPETTDLFSANTCRSFKAGRLCEESALSDCMNLDQKASIVKNLDEVEKLLKCSGNTLITAVSLIAISTLTIFLS